MRVRTRRYTDIFPGAVYTRRRWRACTGVNVSVEGYQSTCGRLGRPTWIWWDNVWTYRCRRHQMK